MKKNIASQLISAQMISATDGSDVTAGTCNVSVEIDGVAGTGGTATHIANGKWEYAPIQADTNGDYLTFQFVISGAITATIQVYTEFPQTGDTYALANGSTGFTAIDTVVDTINSNVGTAGIALTNLGGSSNNWNTVVPDVAGTAATEAEVTAAIAAYDGPTKAEMDTAFTEIKGATWSSATDTLEAIRDKETDIEADTNELQTNQGNWLTVTGHATEAKQDIIDTNVDSILVDTGTTIPATIATVDSNVDAILVDTGTTLPATLTTIEGKIDTVDTVADGIQTDLSNATDGLGAIKTDTAAILTDTGTTLPSSLTTIEGKIDTVDTNVDAVLVDTGTTIPATITTIDTVVDNLNLGIIYGAAATGTLSTTQATTDLTGYTDDQLIGRTIIVTSGVAEGEGSDITDYAETNGTLTFTAMTLAMGNLDTFKIV